MNRPLHAEACGAFCLILVALLVQASQAHAQAEAVPRWPEMPTVQSLLDRELDTLQAARAPRDRRARTTRSASPPASDSLQLLAVYGVDRRLSAQVRVGDDVHTVHAGGECDADSCSVASSTSIVLEAVEGRCVRLRARSARRRVCMPDVAPSAGAGRRSQFNEAQPS